MYVRFQAIVICNFKAFRGRHSLALDGTGVVYLVGENRTAARLFGNGAAKSTIWDALTWCLYGKTARGLRNPDVKSWSGKGKPIVSVACNIDGKDHIVQRTTASNGFTIDGKVEPDIGMIMPMSFELFVNTVLQPQGTELFFDRGPSAKMDLLSEGLDLERWDVRSKAAGELVTSKEDALAQYLDDESAIKGALSEVEGLLKEAKQRSHFWHEEAQKRTTAGKGEVARLKAELEVKQKELDTANLAEDGALTEARHALSEARRLRSEEGSLSAQIGRLRGETSALQEALKGSEEELAGLARAKTCPTCDQPVKPSNLAEHKAHLQTTVRDGKDLLRAAASRLTELNSDLNACATQIAQAVRDESVFSQTATDAQDVIVRVRPLVESLVARIETLSRIKEEANPHLAEVASLNKRRTGLLAELKEVGQDIARAQQKVEQAKFWVKAFKDIKLQLIEEVLQEMELAANCMIEEVGLEDWQVRFSVEKESKKGTIQRLLHVEISSPESKGFVRWESWSGGEQQRLKFVGSRVLADVLLAHAGIETNLEILDEPAVYWSSEGVQELCTFLAIRAREQKKSIWYIEHQAVVSSHFDEVIRVIKDKDGAYIEGEAA